MAIFDPQRYDRRTKIALLLVSLATVVLLVTAGVLENLFPNWRNYRREYAAIVASRADDDRGRAIADSFVVSQIQQMVLPELGRTDRCVTCHTGIDDPRMADLRQPFRAHPGDFLANHPPSQYGCTICHQGQGRALDVKAAHGLTEDWLLPIYQPDYQYSSCRACHQDPAFLERFAPPADAQGPALAALVVKGLELAENRGCMGCHAIDGRGGTLGPDITFVGEKTRHDFDFSHYDGEEKTVTAWLEQHFINPRALSPTTVMPDLNLSQEDARALTAFMLSLRKSNVPAKYIVERPLDLAPEPPRDGAALFAMMCSSCHGPDGRESQIPGLRTPALNNPDTLAVASDDYLRYIIDRGRTDTAMPAWGPDVEGLTRDEIDRIVAHIRGWEAEPPSLDEVDAGTGDVSAGRSIYQGLCANCHGKSGEGGIGNTLNSPTFLGIASDRFLATTIVHGRPNTAMASWKHLSAQHVSDLIAYLRSWQPAPPAFAEVQHALGESAADLRREGELVFRGNCSGCHGVSGEGGIGLRLNGPNVTPMLDDRYLYETIVRGRPSTAMPAWPQLAARQVASLIAYMRSWQEGPAPTLEEIPQRGNYDLGRVHFEIACAQCHGANAEGGVGPQLVNSVLLKTASDQLLYHWIARGRTGTAMRGFLAAEHGPVELEPQHIADVIAHLRYLDAHQAPPVARSGVGNPALGRELYTANCASCHGADGEGLSAPQLHNAAFLENASDGFLAATMVTGRQGTPMQSMIHGAEGLGQIDPDQVQDVIAYMRLWDVSGQWRVPRPVAEVSERAILAGSRHFAAYCAGCHGPTGRGASEGEDYFAPALNNPEFLAAASDGFLLATIARGRANTPMRPFGDEAGGIAALGADEIFDIVSYIRSWQANGQQEGD